MSFSADVKDEIIAMATTHKHCAQAEAYALFSLAGVYDENGKITALHTDSEAIQRKVFTLIKKAFNIDVVFMPSDKRRRLTKIVLSDEENKIILEGTKFNKKILQKECCKRAYLIGAFEAAGSISNPERYYRLEFLCREPDDANTLFDVLMSFNIEPRISERNGDFVVYFQDAEVIAFILGTMGANNAYLNFENIRVTREVKGGIQRRVNCETSNLTKTVKAAHRQIEDIELIMELKGIEDLPDQLKEIAKLRIENEEASLSELGEMIDPPLGRSGVNKRLKKLSEMAEQLRMRNNL